ncbi:transporter substrate-binding domain-containing protein [Maricurvus nonylphenolicus]|uniref:substrate-binding periplasmic protein n=1 Tax=Maricurvus nonylphenolicus TaxID=1008307 RepID=UPI0036F3FD7E
MMISRLIVLLSVLVSLTGNAAITLIYPKPEVVEDYRQRYPVELLSLALKQSGKDYRLKPSDEVIMQLRALKNMELGHDIDVVWSETSVDRESRLRPIRIPIDKGLLGWRISLIRRDDVGRFAGINSLEDLQGLTAGQGHDWPDVDVLWVNGLKVARSSSYAGLFKMLAAGRIDYFPRSIGEVWLEFPLYAGKPLIVDPNILLLYPTALYFFVNKNNQKLADDIEQGLEKLIASGEFDQLFNYHYGDYLKRAKLSERKALRLVNPVLPDKTPLNRQELWLQLNTGNEGIAPQ